MRLAGASGEAPLAEVAGAGWSIAYDLDGAARSVRPTVKDNTATYKGLLADIDLEERSLAEGVKEELIVNKEPGGTDDLRLRFPLTVQGVSARSQPDGSIAFTTPAGERVAVTPPAVVWDADESPARGEGLVLGFKLVAQQSGGQAVDLVVPRSYLADKARRYPVRVDPSIDAGHTTSQYDAYGSSSSPTTNYNGAAQWDPSSNAYVDMVGYSVYPTSEQYTYQYFDLAPVMGKHILSAQWRDWVYQVRGNGFYRTYAVAQDWTQGSVTWNNKPNHREACAEGYATAANFTYLDITGCVTWWAGGTWASKGMAIDTAGVNSGLRLAATEQGSTTNASIVVTYNTLPVAGQPTAPADGATVTTDRPTLAGTSGSDADGNSLCYWFRVSTNPDGSTGSLLNSGCLGAPSWTVPNGALVNGTTYYWRLHTTDGTDWVAGPVRSFKVNLRLGQQGVSPMDDMGAGAVNMANGNLVVGASSRSLDTVGGPIGVSYTYNSKAQQQSGLTCVYTNAANAAWERLIKQEPALDFNWAGGSPGPGIPADNFDMTCDGYITVPFQATNWYFGAVHDDNVTITVNGTTTYSAGCCRGFNDPGFGSRLSLLGGQTVPITVTFHEATGVAALQLWTAGPRYGVVPAQWLSTSPPPLPQGWSMSIDSGADLAYARAVIGDNSIVLIEPSGAVHEYRKQTDQSWRPVDGDDDIVATASENGTTVFVVHGVDGIDYTFNGKGQLIRAVTVTDDRNPAAPRYYYNPTTARLQTIEDPVSLKRIELKYAFPPDGGTTVATDCPKNAAAGLDKEPPIGMLCQVTYWDGSSTKLYYLGAVAETRVLARIEDPGGVVTDFAYDANGRLLKSRAPVATDLIAAGARADDDTTRTVIAYDGAGRVASVTLPAPLAGDARPAHAYSYPSATQTDVSVAGLLTPGAFDLGRRVTYDSAGRLLTDRDTAGLVSSQSWDSEDKVTSSTGPDGLKATTVYDHADRPVERWGPAPASCFGVAPTEPGWSGERPNGSCTAPPVPVTRSAYDENVKGLAAEYWANQNQSGATVLHATGVGAAGGVLDVDWGLGAPSGLATADRWSGRFTGEITFPQSGSFGLKLCADDGVRFFLDEVRVFNDDWITTGRKCRTGTYTVATANTRRRVRIDYFDETSSANLSLYWTPPGGTEQLVPGQYLAPRYSLETSTTDADGRRSATEYALPEYGQDTARVTDPDDGVAPAELNLRTVTSYEAPGTGYFRRTSKALPKGNATTFAYYAPGEAAPANDCGGVAAVGMLKSDTGPTPAAGSAITRRVVYDSLQRVVGRKVDGDSRWACLTYDTRGRVATVTDSSGKTTTYTYSTPGEVTVTYVDSGGAVRSTVEKLDLLGRTWSYTDEHATTTRRTYDQAGRAVAVYRTFAGQGEVKVVEDAYDSAGRLASSTEWVSGAGRTTTYTYDSATGRLTSTTRPNGVVTTTAYDADRGDAISLTHSGPAMATSSWTYARSAARQIVSEATTGRTRSFHYDRAGRLDTTTEGATTRDYAYDANGNRCARATSCATPTYGYDAADRITSSPEYLSYTYDGHGNMTQAVPRSQPPAGALDQTFALDPADPSSFELVAGQAGTLSANLDWTGNGPTYTTQTATGAVAASGTKATPVALDGLGYVTADLTWGQDTHTVSSALGGSVANGSPSATTIPVTATGAVSASVDWSSSTTSNTWSGTVANVGSDTRGITVSANGTVSARLSWPAPAFPNPNPDLNLELLNPSGTVVATGTATGANAESLSYTVTGLGAYPATRGYTLRVNAPALGSTYSLSSTWPVTADVDVELYNPSGTRVANASGSSSKPETISYSATTTGSYSVKVLSKDHAASYTGSASYQQVAFADLTLNLRSPSGTIVASSRSASGATSLTYRAPSGAGGNYSLEIANNSSDLSAPTTSMPWSTTTQGSDSWSGTNVPASGTRSHAVALDGDGWITSSLTYAADTRTASKSLAGNVSNGGPSSTTLPVTAAGPVSASVDWSSSSTSNTWSRSVGNVGSDTRGITVSANGTVSANLSWPAPAFPNPNPDLNLELLNPSGTVVATGTPTGSNAEALSYTVAGMGAYPATRGYTLRVSAPTLGSTYSLSSTWPVTADVDIELYNPSGTRVANATGSSSKPETITYNATATGNYSVKVISKDHAAAFTGSASYNELAYADVTYRLKDPSGVVVATGPTIDHRATSGGAWTLELVDNSTTLTVPSFSADTRIPRTHTATTLQLKDQAGTVVAQNASSDKPKALTTTVAPGRYSLVVTTTGGTGMGTLTASYPGRPGRQVITHDANDHATSVDDGTTLVSEVLSPSGRVIRRTVRDVATGEVSEDVLVSYEDSGDSPSYSRPVGGGVVTTYLVGVVYEGATGSWKLTNLHGDVVGATDAAGAFTAVPVTDEFGLGATPGDRLGWLGGHSRFAVGGSLGLVRMGVRMYDPTLGRFTSVDPVDGGCSNAYAYVFGDPINDSDVSGLRSRKKKCREIPYYRLHWRKLRGRYNYHDGGWSRAERVYFIYYTGRSFGAGYAQRDVRLVTWDSYSYAAYYDRCGSYVYWLKAFHHHKHYWRLTIDSGSSESYTGAITVRTGTADVVYPEIIGRWWYDATGDSAFPRATD